MKKTAFPFAIPDLEAPISYSGFFQNQKEIKDKKLNAIYIPTISLRKGITNIVDICSKKAEKIYILHSGVESQELLFCAQKYSNIQLINVLAEVDFDFFKSIPLSQNPSLLVDKSYDLPLKRNFAMKHSKSMNYKFIGLIDDDILFYEHDLDKAINSLTEGKDIVGFNVLDFPDKGTIGHIRRFITKEVSKVSIGGNFLFMNRPNVEGIFPYVYNEDWLFLFKNILDKKDIVSVGIVRQLYHEPWNNEKRIMFEQFGEVIVTGLYPVLKQRIFAYIYDKEYWEQTLKKYLIELNDLLNHKDVGYWKRPLEIAIRQTSTFEPDSLVKFLKNLKNMERDGKTI